MRNSSIARTKGSLLAEASDYVVTLQRSYARRHKAEVGKTANVKLKFKPKLYRMSLWQHSPRI